MRHLLVAALLILAATPQPSGEPTVRIGLTQNAPAVTVRSASPFSVNGHVTRSAVFASVLALDPAAAALKRSDLQYRVTVDVDGGDVLVVPAGGRLRLEPSGAPLEIETRAYRGAIEVFGNARHSLTVVNELPLEEYLRGVVPNELSPAAFGQLQALEAQAVAARTYIVRNRGQYANEGYDVCASDACQVYLGLKTEDPLSTQAVTETRGLVATYQGQPINALYSSTCGGRTEDAGKIFGEKVPYLVSTNCEYKHPTARLFRTSRLMSDWKAGVLAVAKVASFRDAARFMGLPDPGEPPDSGSLPEGGRDTLASFIRSAFYPTVLTSSDVSFAENQGLVPAGPKAPLGDLLFRLIDKKGAFEWQQGVLTAWDGRTMTLLVNGQPRDFTLAPDALVYQRFGEERVAQREGAWIGGELIDFRAEGTAIPMLVYRINFANPAADRYSRLAMWQVHKSAAELDAAFRSLAIGDFRDMRIVERGESERLVSTEIIGGRGRATVPALKLRTLLGLRDSLFSYDIERNASGAVLGASFFGRGWGHGVGMCQVGAFGMALDGATYEQILKKYYKGIELAKQY